MFYLTDEGDRGALVDGGDVAVSDLDWVLTSARPLEDDQAGGRGRGGQPPELDHATQGGEEVQVGHLALVQALVLQRHRGYVQRGRDPDPRFPGLIDLAQRQPLFETSLHLSASMSACFQILGPHFPRLVPEAVADDPHPGPRLVPLDAVIVPAQPGVHLTGQAHGLAFPSARKL